MVLVPSHLELDGLVISLAVGTPPKGPPRVYQRSDPDRPLLEGLSYVTGFLLHRASSEVLSALENRQRLSDGKGLFATPVVPGQWPDSEYEASNKNWEQLAGYASDLGDVYSVGTSFLDDNIVIPRATLIKLMTRLYEINDALREGRMEPRIDESIPMPPPRPPLPPPPPPRWTDEEVRDVEEMAVNLDQRDPLTEEPSDFDVAVNAYYDRRDLLDKLNIAHGYTDGGYDDLPARFTTLGLTEVLRYQAAYESLLDYLRSPEHAEIVEPAIAAIRREVDGSRPVTCAERPENARLGETAFLADVSVDLFRLPRAARPKDVSELEWLAHCEAAFVRGRVFEIPASQEIAGELFTDVLGHQVRLRYRPELTPDLRLWRVELI